MVLNSQVPNYLPKLFAKFYLMDTSDFDFEQISQANFYWNEFSLFCEQFYWTTKCHYCVYSKKFL